MNRIALRRLNGQELIRPTRTDPVAVVRRQGALQAQDFPAAKWAIGLRTRGVTDADVELLLNDGHILRTHVLRPTWHLVLPEDIRWMLMLTGPLVKARMATYDRQLGLDEAVMRRTNAALTRALRTGDHLTRAELSAVLEKSRVELGTQRLSHILMRAELDGIICSGARRGSHSTHALLELRVPPAKTFTRDEALVELARRYFATRSPATAQDFAWWSGLTVGDAKKGVLMAELRQETIASKVYWFAHSPLRRRSATPLVHLLPNYDEHFIGFRDRSAFGERIGKINMFDRNTPFSAHIIAVDGQIVGGWKRTLAKDTVVVKASLVAPLSSAEQKALAVAAQRYGAFLERPVRLTLLADG